MLIPESAMRALESVSDLRALSLTNKQDDSSQRSEDRGRQHARKRVCTYTVITEFG